MTVTSKTLREALESRIPDARITALAFDGEFEASSNSRREKLLITGKWDGHWMGPFSVTEPDLQTIRANAAGQAIDVLVDYEHASIFSAFTDKTKAAGWIKPGSLEIEPDGDGHALYGVIDWTASAAAAIRDKQFRYKSPTIQRKSKDRKTGEERGPRMHSVALTNTPFLEELPEVTLNSMAEQLLGRALKPKDENMDPKQVAVLAASLGLSVDASPEDMIAAATAQAADGKAMLSVAAALGLDEGSDVEAIVAAATSLKARSMTEDEIATLREQAAAGLSVQVASAVEAATKEGKIVASNKEWATELATKDFAAFSKWAETAPPIVPTTPKAPGKGKPSTLNIDPLNVGVEDFKAIAIAMSDEHRANALSFGLTQESYIRGNLTQILAEING